MPRRAIKRRPSLSPPRERRVVHHLAEALSLSPPTTPVSLLTDRSCYLGHCGHCDDDLRRRIPQPLGHRYNIRSGLRLHVSPLQGTCSPLNDEKW